MTVATKLVVVHSNDRAAARCIVCGNEIAEGEGVTADYQGQAMRFKCPGCYARFQADPDRYLAGAEPVCCKEDQSGSPVSEWRCD